MMSTSEKIAQPVLISLSDDNPHPNNREVREMHIQQQSDPASNSINVSTTILQNSIEPNNSKDIVIPNCFPSSFCCRHFQQPLLRMNHNVFLALLLDVLYGISVSLWSGTVFVAYLKRWSAGQNYMVGDIEALNGLAVLISALPIGYLADIHGRSRVIKAGAILIACTALCHLLVIRWIGTSTKSTDSQGRANLDGAFLCVIMALWGVGGGIVSGPCDALFADSTPAGERSTYYHYSFVCYMVASCCGPLLSIIMFQSLGDDWALCQLQTILYVGLSLEFFNAVLMLLFDDSKALVEDNHADATSASSALATTRNADEEQSQQIDCMLAIEQPEDSLDSSSEVDELQRPLLASQNDSGHQNDSSYASNQEIRRCRQLQIPYILFASSLVTAMGSGMTVKFFPLFFKDQVHLSPTQVQGIYVVSPLTTALFSGRATSISRWFGRVQTTVLLSTVGVVCLLAIAFGIDQYFKHHHLQLVVVYLLYTALTNCTYPLYESILMDFVPQQYRARWKSLESVSQFGWCGSAALGGYISDRWSYNHLFGVTAALQCIGIFLFALLLPLVPRREQDLVSSERDNALLREV